MSRARFSIYDEMSENENNVLQWPSQSPKPQLDLKCRGGKL